MKTWMKAILASLLILIVCPLTVPAAAGAGGVLTVEGGKVDVTLNLPEGETEGITSLRLWLYVSVGSGQIKDPSFAFNPSVTSRVKSADIRKSEEGSYVADLILSGKREQDIFAGKTSVSLGSLSLESSDGQAFTAAVGIAGEDGATGDGSQPVVKYVNSSGTETLTIPLAEDAPVQVPGSVEDGKPDLKPDTNPQPDVTDQTETRPGMVKSFTVQFQDTKKVSASWKKADGAEGYQIYRSSKKNGKYTLLKTVKKGTTVKATGIKHKDGTIYYYKIRAYRTGADGETLYGAYTSPVTATVKAPAVTYKTKGGWLTLNWKKIPRADGYVIYQYNAKTKSYKTLAQIYGQKTVTYSYKLSAGKTVVLKVRAYEKQKNKSRIYGGYSKAVQCITAPSKLAKVAARAGKTGQATVSWKKTGGADGYQVYRSTKKNSSYKRAATISGGSKVKWADKKLKSGKTYYYKVRAYRKGANAKKVYGKFTEAVKVKAK